METVFGLMLMLIAVCHGVETSCDGRQDGARCYGALGGAVDLQLMDASEIKRFQWKKGGTLILQWKNNQIMSNIIENRSLFIPSNGTFRINNLSRNDSGEYKLVIFDSNGTETGQRTLQMLIQAPVSSVQLVSECSSQGHMKVSCSSEGGDSPQYSWTLDGHTLTDSELLFRNNETNIIVLRQNVSGRLTCSVRNHVSNLSKQLLWDQPVAADCGFIFINCTSNGTHISEWVFKENNTLCVEPTTTTTTTTTGPHSTVEQLPIVAGVLSALVICLIVGIAVICTQRKKTKNNAEEDDQELTYADINIVQQRGRRAEQRAMEEEVEYGQVKISTRPRQSEPVMDDTVYAQVRKAR
ncbi:T-cell surface antigen CD2-like isoform X2 [Kryptolebias marmoratus]|uniref:T-cell surface antigen CD2-like isoform X2 n=1 Tax=Kryptolebias marmoratus TaxID=37003 RepID=UPI000D53107B|nr:T-cell surface antigen CD2-like isoform X2 [Kryptolebias marmoratus]